MKLGIYNNRQGLEPHTLHEIHIKRIFLFLPLVIIVLIIKHAEEILMLVLKNKLH
jgi:hypothetical protein